MEEHKEARFFQTVLRCVADGVFTVDCNWRITSFNEDEDLMPILKSLWVFCACSLSSISSTR